MKNIYEVLRLQARNGEYYADFASALSRAITFTKEGVNDVRKQYNYWEKDAKDKNQPVYTKFIGNEKLVMKEKDNDIKIIIRYKVLDHGYVKKRQYSATVRKHLTRDEKVNDLFQQYARPQATEA